MRFVDLASKGSQLVMCSGMLLVSSLHPLMHNAHTTDVESEAK